MDRGGYQAVGEFPINSMVEESNSNYVPSIYESSMSVLGDCLSLGFCCCAYLSVNRGQIGLITQYGRYVASKDEGLHYVNMLTQRMVLVDTRRTTHALEKQTVLTSDNLQVQIDGVVFYYVTDPVTVAFRVNQCYSVIANSALVALRNTFGGYTLQEALEHRDEISQEVCKLLRPHMTKIGVNVEEVQVFADGFIPEIVRVLMSINQLTDIIIPENISEALSAQAISERTARARITLAKADVEAAMIMKECAASLSTPAAMQIRILDTLQTMAANSKSSVIFMPTSSDDIMRAFGAKIASSQT